MLPMKCADSHVMDKPVSFVYFGICSSVANWMENGDEYTDEQRNLAVESDG
jgi:hypothetical protein